MPPWALPPFPVFLGLKWLEFIWWSWDGGFPCSAVPSNQKIHITAPGIAKVDRAAEHVQKDAQSSP